MLDTQPLDTKIRVHRGITLIVKIKGLFDNLMEKMAQQGFRNIPAPVVLSEIKVNQLMLEIKHNL